MMLTITNMDCGASAESLCGFRGSGEGTRDCLSWDVPWLTIRHAWVREAISGALGIS